MAAFSSLFELAAQAERQLDPLAVRYLLQVPPPRLQDGLSDLDRMERALCRKWGAQEVVYTLSVMREAADALRAEVRVLAGALGTELGASIPDHGAPLRDSRGALVISRRRVERLERLAAATGGEVYRADAWGTFDLEAAAAAIRRDAGRAPGQRVERRVRAAQVLPLAALVPLVSLLSLLWLPKSLLSFPCLPKLVAPRSQEPKSLYR